MHRRPKEREVDKRRANVEWGGVTSEYFCALVVDVCGWIEWMRMTQVWPLRNGTRQWILMIPRLRWQWSSTLQSWGRRTRGAALKQIHDMGTRRYVLSVTVDNDNEFRSRCDWISVRHFGSTTYVLYMFVMENPSVTITIDSCYRFATKPVEKSIKNPKSRKIRHFGSNDFLSKKNKKNLLV
jgi:hypothetical protein